MARPLLVDVARLGCQVAQQAAEHYSEGNVWLTLEETFKPLHKAILAECSFFDCRQVKEQVRDPDAATRPHRYHQKYYGYTNQAGHGRSL